MEKLQPKLRFPEFEEDWELTTFNKFFKIGSSKRVLQDDWKTEGIPFYRTRELVKLANKEEIKNDIYIKEDLYNNLKEKYGVPQIGDILVSGVGTLGISYIVENLNSFYFKDGNVIWFKKICCIDSKYFNYIFQNNFVQNQIFDNASITTVGTFTIENANKTKFYYSKKIEEQTKIANFLSAVDEKLNLLKEKKSLLEDYKKGIMQKIFNQEIRFKDDNGNDFEDWKVDSLGNISKIYDGTHQTPNYVSEGIPFYSVEHITANQFSKTKFITETVFDKENKRVQLEKGDILMTRIGSIGVAKYINWDVKASFYVSLALIKKNENINNEYLCHFINSPFFQNELWERTIHVAFPKKINLGEIGDCLVKFPSLKEQSNIANFLSAIDEKIELVSNQIQDIQEYKKGLLQQMFI